MKKTNIFISYSWDGEEHQQWVQGLARDLEEFAEFHVVTDFFDLDNFSDKNYFMEKSVREADIVIVVCTENYKRKADSRQGGVGIETYLSVIRHWEESEGGGASRMLVVAREKSSIPYYLQGKFRVDFYNDDLYQKSLDYLVKALSKKSKIPRPEKRRSLDRLISYDFNRAEDILRLKYSKRKALIGVEEGTDFSSGNRVKFELWEVSSPFKSHYLVLYPNITISQTINRFCDLVKSKGVVIQKLTVLRPVKGDESLIQRLIEKQGLSIEIADLPYDEYIWEYCIDEGLRVSPDIRANKFYTDQALRHLDVSTEEEGKSESAIGFLISSLSGGVSSAHLVTATGGMGKSTLCHELAIALNKKFQGEKAVVLIKAESLRNNFSNEFVSNIEVRSLYDLYDLHAQISNLDAVYDRNQFELCVLCGRVVVIVDGLDEFASILQERFSVADFLSSIRESHRQMGRGQVILTSRNMAFVDDIALDDVAVRSHELLGFDEASRAKYIRKRFSKYSKADDIIALFAKYIDQLKSFDDQHDRIVPFFVDIVSTIFEEQLSEHDRISFEISSEDRDYACNSGLIDLIVFSVLRREKTRHDIDLETKDFVDLFSELAIECGEIMPCEKLREKLHIYYDDIADSLYSKVVINPLLLHEGDALRFRYQFLNDYFKSLFLIAGILRSSFSKDMVRSLANAKDTAQQSMSDVVMYFTNQDDSLLHNVVKSMIGTARSVMAREDTEPREKELIKKAIGTLLAVHSRCGRFQRADLSRKVRDIYQISDDLDVEQKIEGLYLYGDYPSLDFSNLQVWDSGFYNYENFITSRFSKTRFFYSEFSNTGGTYASESFDPTMFDSTCKLGDLSETVAYLEGTKKSNKALCESELKKFFRSFFKGLSFVDQKMMYMQFSGKVEKLGRRNFDYFLKSGILELYQEKNVDKFYVVSAPYQDSVHKFLNDNFVDAKIKGVIDYLRS